jgi:hypothetical protein
MLASRGFSSKLRKGLVVLRMRLLSLAAMKAVAFVCSTKPFVNYPPWWATPRAGGSGGRRAGWWEGVWAQWWVSRWAPMWAPWWASACKPGGIIGEVWMHANDLVAHAKSKRQKRVGDGVGASVDAREAHLWVVSGCLLSYSPMRYN